MKGIRKGLAAVLVFISLFSQAQVGFGFRAGLQQSLPLVKRDTFSGSPTFSAAFSLYIPYNNKMNFVAGVSYRPVSVSYKEKSQGLNWQTMGLNLGTEWLPAKITKTTFYTGLNVNYVLGYSQKVLAGSSSTGTASFELEPSQKVVPSIELGITFKPRPHININISTIQTIPQTTYNGRPTLPGTFSFSLEYVLNSKDIKNIAKDTTPSAEKLFAQNLKSGTLYFIEEGTDSSHAIFRSMFAEVYNYSKVDFIKISDLKMMLEKFQASPQSNKIFIAKAGVITYDINRASTQGIIIYNYKMENPIPDNPFFVRNLAGNSYFQDPAIVKKLLRTLNNRLYKMFKAYEM